MYFPFFQVKSKLRSEGDGAEISDKLEQDKKSEADDVSRYLGFIMTHIEIHSTSKYVFLMVHKGTGLTDAD